MMLHPDKSVSQSRVAVCKIVRFVVRVGNIVLTLSI